MTKDNNGLLTIEELHFITEPVRAKILGLLTSEGDMYITELAESVKQSNRNTSFHCMELAKQGYIEGKFDENRNGRASKFYSATKKAFEAIEQLPDVRTK